MKLRLLLVSMLFILGLMACQKDQGSSKVLIFVSPEANHLTMNDGEYLKFSINCRSATSKLNKFQINTDKGAAVFDTLIGNTIFSHDYHFRLKNRDDEQKRITLFFKATNNNGQTASVGRSISIVMTDSLMKETTGHILYSGLSQKANGFDLLTLQPSFTAYDDSSQIHLMDNTDSSQNPEQKLSGRWETLAGNTFVRYNDFDYAKATNQSVRQAFEVAKNKAFVSDIQPDDIILTRLTSGAHYVIRVRAVMDPEASEYDRYIFDLKREIDN